MGVWKKAYILLDGTKMDIKTAASESPEGSK